LQSGPTVVIAEAIPLIGNGSYCIRAHHGLPEMQIVALSVTLKEKHSACNANDEIRTVSPRVDSRGEIPARRP
jgi:hypothetical protein